MAQDQLSTEKTDTFIKEYEVTKLNDIGSKAFYTKYVNLLRLHRLIGRDANEYKGERLTDAFIKYGKFYDLVEDLIITTVWIEKVLPELFKVEPAPMPDTLVTTYLVFYYESVLVQLLYSLLLQSASLSEIPNCILIDLIDYCAYKFLINPLNLMPSDLCVKYQANTIENIEYQHRFLSQLIIVQCLSMLKLICDNLDKLPLNIASRMYSTHDLPVIIVNLFDSDIWSRIISDKFYKFNETKWQKISEDNLSKTEIQMLLLIDRLIMKADKVKYIITDSRKQQLTRLIKYLTNSVVDQINPLSDLKIWLMLNCLNGEQDLAAVNAQQLHRTDVPTKLDGMSQFRDALFREYNGKWYDIANGEKSKDRFKFIDGPNDMAKISKKFIMFLENYEKLTNSMKTCLICLAKAVKKCSKCKKAWYCSRQCQLKHWPVHKQHCQAVG